MIRRAPAMGVWILGLIAAACTGESKPAEWHQETGYRWRELSVRRGSPGFSRISAKETGINFQNFVSDSALLGNRILGQGAGVALGDVDGDGLPDVFLGRTEGCSALYKNLGNWRFQDVTQSAG
ncbi:MAG TPA: VCBS repeat-containing protein, partial [Gemmatimonadaceae bacterium]|nr:VCBS repeat-containing protein [Gemmatimonadaceae bacterium]